MAYSFPRGRLRPRQARIPERAPRALSAGLLSLSLLTTLLLSFLMPGPARATPAPDPPSNTGFTLPLEGPIIVPYRAARGHYGEGGHAGVDIGAAPGSAARACGDGIVGFSGRTPLGICVSVMHGSGLKTTYVGLASAAVAAGHPVRRGSVLGTTDGTRDRSSSLPHLHLGASFSGVAFDPMLLFAEAWDPSACLFLGPSDSGAPPHYSGGDPGGGGFWSGLYSIATGTCNLVKRGVGVMARAAASPVLLACRLVAGGARALATALPWCGEQAMAALSACGRLLQPVGRAIAAVASEVFSNRIVQAALACIAACVIVTALVVSVAVALGVSVAATVAAVAAGAAGCIGYAIYYCAVSGDSFSLLRCFEGCLMLGGTAAGVTVLGAYLGGFISSGLGRVGLVGAGKSFLINGTVDACMHSLLSRIFTGRASLSGALFAFALGGLIGAAGHLFIAGYRGALFSREVAGGLAFALSREGGGWMARSAAGRQLAKRAGRFFIERIAFMTASGSAATLTSSLLHMLAGEPLSLAEGCITFTAGFIVGGFSLAYEGGGLTAVLTRLSGGRLVVRSEFFRVVVTDLAGRGLQPALSRLRWYLRRLSRRGVMP
ncbi:MAG: M23 family metallopeptidase [Candidatus Geothermincolia bacterium]